MSFKVECERCGEVDQLENRWAETPDMIPSKYDINRDISITHDLDYRSPHFHPEDLEYIGVEIKCKCGNTIKLT